MEKDQSGEDKMARGRNGKGQNGKIPGKGGNQTQNVDEGYYRGYYLL